MKDDEKSSAWKLIVLYIHAPLSQKTREKPRSLRVKGKSNELPVLPLKKLS